MTVGRLKRLVAYFNNNEDINASYGDALSSFNLRELIGYHNSHSASTKVTAVRPIVLCGINP